MSFFVPSLISRKTNTSSGFQDEESYEQFKVAFDSFIRDCQTEGYTSSPAQVGSRSPFQLAVMISPLYLLVTIRLSTKSFHRRNVIDMAARLGAHKTPRILAVENLIWDGIFRLAEGHTSVHTVLRDLSDSLPWPDIDIASNCDADKQWFALGPRMFFFFFCDLGPPPNQTNVDNRNEICSYLFLATNRFATCYWAIFPTRKYWVKGAHNGSVFYQSPIDIAFGTPLQQLVHGPFAFSNSPDEKRHNITFNSR